MRISSHSSLTTLYQWRDQVTEYSSCLLSIRESTLIPVHPRTTLPVGYAFINLSTADEAQKAVAELTGKSILGRKVEVQLSRKSAKDQRKEEDKKRQECPPASVQHVPNSAGSLKDNGSHASSDRYVPQPIKAEDREEERVFPIRPLVPSSSQLQRQLSQVTHFVAPRSMTFGKPMDITNPGPAASHSYIRPGHTIASRIPMDYNLNEPSSSRIAKPWRPPVAPKTMRVPSVADIERVQAEIRKIQERLDNGAFFQPVEPPMQMHVLQKPPTDHLPSRHG